MSPTATRKAAAPAPRLDVRKTYKLYIGGKFPRSESGRSYEVVDGRGRFLANASMGSRKGGPTSAPLREGAQYTDEGLSDKRALRRVRISFRLGLRDPFPRRRR